MKRLNEKSERLRVFANHHYKKETRHIGQDDFEMLHEFASALEVAEAKVRVIELFGNVLHGKELHEL